MACHQRLWTAHTKERRRACHDITALGQHTWSNDIGRGMTSPPMDSRDNRQRRAWHDITTIGLHTVGRRQAFHDITDLGQHTRSDYVRRGMTSSPLYGTHDRTTSSVGFHYRLWAAQKVELRRAWHAIIAFGQHTRSNDVGRGMATSPLGSTRSKDVGRGMTSPPFDSAHGRTTSGATCHHRLRKAHTVERRQAWHSIMALGHHTWSNDVRRDMTSPP